MKYIVEVAASNVAAFKAQASFAKRSSAIAYASEHENVQVRRKTDYTNRIVFSRSTSSKNGFVTVTESETVRVK